MPPTQAEKYDTFVALHEAPDIFVIPNPWDAGTARMLTTLGFPALATTSSGLAIGLARRSSAREVSRDAVLENARTIAEATPLPVSADLEDCFGDTPEACAETMRRAVAAGLVGGSIEDANGGRETPIYDFGEAVERVSAVCEAVKGQPILVTARADNFINGRPDLDDTIERLRAFSAAGAHVLYAPALPSLEAIRTLCGAVDKPVNVVMGLTGPVFTVADLREAGVRRISVGGAFARAALGAFVRAAKEVAEKGSFDFAADALSGAEIRRLLALD
ncbi:MAG: isocitrate lyase/phosphoenolpyruvate mutase family protein [Rhodospirillaceae bacterium]|jgi:2-methylisocitrate lyase-like PEP mutase family enzyme|nr:isocitrate lyase/phosphoenolpyruvate mutase family protein [Rhodospirillaceae bacterium]MBT6119072.1 isocitrate lyase/phosphoenolpyruvate mutase family protein [Rhodospirillaceae bacterium]